jgi:ssRNA-specific RNase YbeY (16S rRNA maturation enzyme)
MINGDCSALFLIERVVDNAKDFINVVEEFVKSIIVHGMLHYCG